MRSITAAAALVATFATGVASAQMKPKPAPTPAPAAVTGQIGTSNNAVQISTVQMGGEPSLESARRIERDEAIKLVKAKKAVWVDVRPKDQYDLGHIKGAINVPLGEIVTGMKLVPPGKMIITYCA
jgi:3-mercaptopyruvate sulfurtransferase SseA